MKIAICNVCSMYIYEFLNILLACVISLNYVLFFMALQLKLNKLERTELDASLRNKSEKFEELVEEVKHSR